MRKSALTMMLLAAVCLWGCQDQQLKPLPSGYTPPARGPVVNAGTAADGSYRLHEKDLAQLGLEVYWESRLHATETLVDAYQLGNLVIMETRPIAASRNIKAEPPKLYAVDRKTGEPQWIAELPYRCDFRGGEDADSVFVSCRNILLSIDKRGFIAWREFMKYAPGGQPVVDDMHVYLPCFDGRVRSFLKESGYFDRQFTTYGPVEARPAFGPSLVFAGSTDKWVYALSADKLERVWKYETFGPIRGGVVYDDRRVFAASTDGNLYCLNASPQDTPEAQLAWPRPYASGAPIAKTPYVTEDMALVINERAECHAVDRKTGGRLWMVSGVDRVLAQGRLNTYVIRGANTILAIDNKKGSIRWELQLPPGVFAYVLTNTIDDVIYLVKSNGNTQAIREVKPPVAAPVVAPEAAPAE